VSQLNRLATKSRKLANAFGFVAFEDLKIFSIKEANSRLTADLGRRSYAGVTCFRESLFDSRPQHGTKWSAPAAGLIGRGFINGIRTGHQ